MVMENFDDLVFDDEEFIDEAPEQKPEQNQQQVENNEQEDDLTSEVLRLKGINDLSKIKFEDETGAVIERSWDSLSREEQINILSDTRKEKEDDNQLNDDEIELINTIRNSGMSIQEYMESLQPVQQTKSYKVDSLSDEDLYALDLLEKIGSDNISDEEITKAIEVAKQNEDLFKKTVEGIRKEYIRLQEDEEAQLAQEQAAKQEEAYQQFAASIYNEIKGLNSFAGRELELSDDDIEELSDFILNLDDSGMSAFGRAMNDPALFTKAAFWILNEDKIKEELTRQIQDSYKKGYETAKQDLSKNNTTRQTSKLVFNNNQQTKKVDDYDFIDDIEW